MRVESGGYNGNCGVEMTIVYLFEYGEVAEWLKAHAWKACIGANQSQVRILFSPPYLFVQTLHIAL
jgi:hypothetical protein